MQQFCWISNNHRKHKKWELNFPNYFSKFEKLIKLFTLISFCYQLGHFNVTLWLQSTDWVIQRSPFAKVSRWLQVKDTYQYNVDAHVKACLEIYCIDYHYEVVQEVAVLCNKIKYGPVLHVSVHHERKSESCAFVKFIKIFLNINIFFLVYTFFIEIFLYLLFYLNRLF